MELAICFNITILTSLLFAQVYQVAVIIWSTVQSETCHSFSFTILSIGPISPLFIKGHQILQSAELSATLYIIFALKSNTFFSIFRAQLYLSPLCIRGKTIMRQVTFVLRLILEYSYLLFTDGLM